MKKFSKGPSRPSRSTEYERKLAELENFIAKNRLVSKEAQMSSMSGEGYTDPRFFKTTGNPLIDKYGMRPFPAEGSGQILSTTQLGMSGKNQLFNPRNPGTYSPSKDTVVYKDVSKFGYEDKNHESTQKHEIFHRAAQRSGWINNFYNSPYLKKKAKSLAGERGRILAPLINEAVAHSYEYDADDYSKNKELKETINFRASKFNLKNPEKISDEIFNNIEDLRDDFEKYIELVNVEYLPNNRISYTTTRTNKATGDEVSYLQSALDMLTQSAPVTEAPPSTFDLGTIEPFNPIMERYKPNPLDEFVMMMADPTKKLKVISTPIKMQLKPLFAKRNKIKQLIDKQKFNYDRGQDLASKADPDAIDQGNYMMNAAIKSGQRFQKQLNELEEKIRKIYQSK
jgi:hypothetical protein